MVNFKMTDNDYTEQSKYFEEGVHKVKIAGAIMDKMDDGREYVEIGVEGSDGETAEVRMWLHSEKAFKFTMRTLQGIAVHNAKDDVQKEKIRQFFVGDFDDAKIKKVLEKLDGYEAWFTVYQSDRTYTNAQGETRHSYDRNIHSYEPKPKKTTVEDLMGPVEKVSTDDIQFA